MLSQRPPLCLRRSYIYKCENEIIKCIFECISENILTNNILWILIFSDILYIPSLMVGSHNKNRCKEFKLLSLRRCRSCAGPQVMSHPLLKYVEHCLWAGTRPAPAIGRHRWKVIFSTMNLKNVTLWHIIMMIASSNLWRICYRQVAYSLRKIVIASLQLRMELWSWNDGTAFSSKLAVCPVTSTPPLSG